MQVDIAISNSALDSHPLLAAEDASEQTGAIVEFKGLVRREEAGIRIAALEYEAYQPMAENTMHRIAEDLGKTHACDRVVIVHRSGIVPVGEAAIIVRVCSKHRAESFALLTHFMDRLKQDVPIWKIRSIPLTEKPIPANIGKQSPGFSEVLAIVEAACQPLPTERFPLANAFGRVLRETITAPEDQPAFPRSAVDGVALRLDDRSEEFLIVDEIRAGDWRPRQLQLGEAVRISTGGAMPSEGLQVVMIEDVELADGRCRVKERSNETHIRVRGEDVRRGGTLLASGSSLTAGAISLLAGIGHIEPLVTRQPRIVHFTTGDELVSAQQTPGPGQIRDSNTPLVAAFFQQLGLTVAHHHLPENLAQANTALAHHATEIAAADILIFSGGASVGAHDHTPQLLHNLGFELKIHGTRLRPGKPLLFATSGPRLAFGLPGNPLAHFVGLIGFVRAAIAKLTAASTPKLQPAILASPLQAGGNTRETLWPASLSLRNGTLIAEPLRWSNSGDLATLAHTNGLILLAPGTGLLDQSTPVNVLACTQFP
ncbi:MAG: molybdenum cofactor biosynthesis protein MoaE [Verrucomicrobia bacterium]|nr:molybdenum cofactor biosynthesis protein MoaE [Verrucomicrobiota bacterium]